MRKLQNMRMPATIQIRMIVMIVALLITLAGFSEAGDMPGGDSMNGEVNKTAKALVVIGASYAGGWKPQSPVADYQIVNKGVSGQQSFEMLARFETDVVALKPDAVIIWGFINDIFRSDRDRMEQTLSRTRESLTAMVRLARKAGIQPILATEVTIRARAGLAEVGSAFMGRLLGKESYQDYINGQVMQMNLWIKDMAAHEGILLLDYQVVLSDSNGVRKKVFAQEDGSHISQAGYGALTEYTERQLIALMRAS